MAEFHHRAGELAVQLEARGLRVHPSPPHTNAFRIHVEGEADAVNERMVGVMEREHVAVTRLWSRADVPGWAWTEFTVGPATMGWEVDEVVDQLERVALG